MKLPAGLCLMLALGVTAASAESPSPLKPVNLFGTHENARGGELQAVAEAPAPVLAHEIRLTEFRLKKEGDRVLQARLTIGNEYAPSATRVGDIRGQALVTVHMSFRTLP
jgi:hypothetical protein